MKRNYMGLLALAVFGVAQFGRADFKYTESSKMTGGMMASMSKLAGAFSKDARKASAPQQTSIYLKSNRMRTEESDGSVKIIDLDGRRFVDIKTKDRTYSIMTFDQMRVAMEQAKQRAQQQMQQAQAKTKGQQPSNVKVVPKFEVTPTGNTRTILGLSAKEVKVRMDMEMQSDDPQYKGQSASTWVTSDSWITSSIPGYDEVRRFQEKMAKELDWMPGEVFGGQAAPSMAEFRKKAAKMDGVPLIEYISFGMAASGQQASSGGQAQPQAPANPDSSQSSSAQSGETPTNPGAAIAKGLGGVFKGFGRKKKQDQEDQSGAASSPGAPPPPQSPSGSMMDMTREVVSFSSDPLDSSLFEIPAGYTEVESDAAKALGGQQH